MVLPDDCVWIVWHHNGGYSLFGDDKRFVAVYLYEHEAKAALKQNQFYTKEDLL